MKYKQMKRLLKIVSIIIIVFGILYMLKEVNSAYDKTLCKGMIVNISYQDSIIIIDDKEIIEYTYGLYNDISKIRIKDINLSSISEIIKTHPYVLSAKIFKGVDGYIHAEVIQRSPLVRVFNTHSESFIIDREGVIIPLRSTEVLRIPVASGFIIEKFDDIKFKNVNALVNNQKSLLNIYDFAMEISKDNFLTEQISQIYILKNGNIEIIPAIGNHTIHIGNLTNLEEKLFKLHILYSRIATVTNMKKYSYVNLEYKNQIVCKKI